MEIKNFEFKVKVAQIDIYERKLLSLRPTFIGTDHQVDTYFNAPHGRLKLRAGNIENALIHYERENIEGVKESKILLYQHQPDSTLKEILTRQLGVKVVVDKIRKIYFIDNVKFHFDEVKGLGTYIEVEAIDSDNHFSLEILKKQCAHYFHFFQLDKNAFVDKSYSDLLSDLNKHS